MKTRPSLSILMPTYRDERFVAEAVRSALAQNPDIVDQITISDDGSPPGMLRLLSELACARLEVRTRSANVGLFANLNAAIRGSSTDWILLLCQDDVLLPTAAETASRHLDGASLVLFANESMDEEGRPRETIQRAVYDRIFDGDTRLFGPDELTPWLLKEGALNGNLTGMVMRRDVFVALGGFDETRRQIPDWELLHRFSRHGGVRIVKAPIARLRVHSGQLSAVNSRAGTNTEEVGYMVRLLLADPALASHPDAARWARGVMQHHLWFALKAGMRRGANRDAVAKALRAVSQTTGLTRTSVDLVRLLPRRVLYRAGLIRRDEPLTR